MTARVYTLTETTDRTGFALGVFAERVLAIEAALSHAEYRIARCIAADEKTFGRPVPEGTYVTSLVEPDEHAKVVIVHRPSGEEDGTAWQIWPFDVVERPGLSDAVQHGLFCGERRAP
jgi:hypothetical protein